LTARHSPTAAITPNAHSSAAAQALNRDEAELGREVKKWRLREEG
jgi:hypothetical protein